MSFETQPHDRIAWLPSPEHRRRVRSQSERKELTLPQGTVMAYKRKQLVFRENGRGEQGLKGVRGVGDRPEATLASLPAGRGGAWFLSLPQLHLQARKTEP